MAENRGTIVQSNPEKFISTGWNLFNPAVGYAIGLKYAETAQFRVKGTYTAVKFSATIDGAKTTILPVDGLFTISSNGYIWVENSGGTLADVQVYMTWTDWVGAGDGPQTYEAYTESVIDMSGLFGEDNPFEYGLLQAGDVRDEINFNTGVATRKIDRLAYSTENRAAAEASGRTYEYDTNYIYLERAEYIETDLDDYLIDGAYDADDHGMEMFSGTPIAVYAVAVYGNSLKNKLETDVLTISAQTLTSAQQGQARTNIGAASQADVTALNSKLENPIQTEITISLGNNASVGNVTTTIPFTNFVSAILLYNDDLYYNPVVLSAKNIDDYVQLTVRTASGNTTAARTYKMIITHYA